MVNRQVKASYFYSAGRRFESDRAHQTRQERHVVMSNRGPLSVGTGHYERIMPDRPIGFEVVRFTSLNVPVDPAKCHSVRRCLPGRTVLCQIVVASAVAKMVAKN